MTIPVDCVLVVADMKALGKHGYASVSKPREYGAPRMILSMVQIYDSYSKGKRKVILIDSYNHQQFSKPVWFSSTNVAWSSWRAHPPYSCKFCHRLILHECMPDACEPLTVDTAVSSREPSVLSGICWGNIGRFSTTIFLPCLHRRGGSFTGDGKVALDAKIQPM